MTLQKAKLPQAVEVGGRFYKIHTDFKYFLRFRELLLKKSAELNEFDFMYIADVPDDRAAGITALWDFMNPPQILPRSTGEKTGEVLDYDLDAQYIYAAFMEQYGIDIIDTPLHWHKFSALLRGLHDTELNKIIAARLWKDDGKNDDYTRNQRKQQEAWRLPDPGDNEPDEALEEFQNALKGKKENG